MLFRKGSVSFVTLTRRFSTAIVTTKKLPILRCVNEIPSKYRSRALREAQQTLRDYFHATKSLPFVFAELIAKNSPFSLANLVVKVHFTVRDFSASLAKLLRYEPINEFEFFLESIGIDYRHVHRFLPRNKFFFSDDSTAIDAAFSLSQFGFPWNSLGKLLVEEIRVFRCSSDCLIERLSFFKERYGFDNLSLVAICLVFPRLLLRSESDSGCDDSEAIFEDLKRVLAVFDVGCCVEGNVDAWYDVCCKIKVFYDLGCEIGTVGELMCEGKDVLLRCPKEVLLQKADFFIGFGVAKVDVGLLLLKNPEILNYNLGNGEISVLGLLEHFGLDANELECVKQMYPYVFGRNKLANLPNVMKALDLHQWCFDKIKGSNGQLLATYKLSCCEEGIDKGFLDAFNLIKSSRLARHSLSKVEFLKEIGFAENSLTVSVLTNLHGTRSELQERFNFLISSGIRHSKLCLMIVNSTKILTQSPEKLDQKLKFLCGEMGHSLDYLCDFPNLLYFDLEKRIKRRCRFYVWLQESDLPTKEFAVTTLIASSEKKFVDFLYDIHPAVPKHYFERF